MKILVLLTLALCVSQAWGFGLPMTMQFMSECKRQEGAGSNELIDARLDDTETPSQELKCFYNCILEKSTIFVHGEMSPVFQYGLDLAIEQYSFNPQLQSLMRSFKDCAGLTGSDKCDRAYNYMKCLRPKMARSMFL